MLFTHQAAYWVENMPADYKINYPGTVNEYREKARAIFDNIYDNEFDYTGDIIDESFFERLFSIAVDVSVKYDVPLYCGEYGVIDKADAESAVRWFADIHSALEKFDISRAIWCYKEMDFGLTEDHYSDVVSEIIKYL